MRLTSSTNGDCPFPWTETIVAIGGSHGAAARTADSDSAKVLATDGSIKETRGELVFFMVTNFIVWGRGGTLHMVVSSCQVPSNVSNGAEMNQTDPTAKVTKAIC